jgi:hypothetical protein
MLHKYHLANQNIGPVFLKALLAGGHRQSGDDFGLYVRIYVKSSLL